ncbi:hypothetical protein FDA33_15245 [Clostridium botulinum]|uniref:energy coupling factor transporter S component ThiW n=1 Tax=Clostridium botulinum TaxID=1491 RepID=UPI0013F04DB7|nr:MULTISPECIES: energy coupling factor transporter S component ThiW [Clostridium]MBN1043242.1 hypothetical protein [Clostridium botulinum]MBY7025483.1 energy coupling factor transporter S component ThiW [Clostridium botulinum]NFH91540.1 hypothetical protein [Clostridium botulinum]NFI18049.1 hypothetical protein [Clostridium botulinum]NFI52891.1 hypothetical protein [Clostridium botulinum]
MNDRSKAQKIALSGVLISLAVLFGTFSIPIGIAKVSPVQHFVNVVGAIIAYLFLKVPVINNILVKNQVNLNRSKGTE